MNADQYPRMAEGEVRKELSGRRDSARGVHNGVNEALGEEIAVGLRG